MEQQHIFKQCIYRNKLLACGRQSPPEPVERFTDDFNLWRSHWVLVLFFLNGEKKVFIFYL